MQVHWPWVAPTLTVASTKLQNTTEVFNFWNFQKKWPVWDKLIAVGRFQSAGAKSGLRRVDTTMGRSLGGGPRRVSWVGDGVVWGARRRGGRHLGTWKPTTWQPHCQGHQLLAALHLGQRQWLDEHRPAADRRHHGQDGAAAHGQQLLGDLVWERGPRSLQGLAPGETFCEMSLRSWLPMSLSPPLG